MNKVRGGGGGQLKGGLREGGLIEDLPVYGCVWWQYVTILSKKDEGDYFSQNFVYILRTTTRHMVSFIDFYSYFQANFQT